MASRARALLCAWRLSMTTICPAWRLGARICSTYSSKAVVLADPSRISAAPRPSRERAAISVVFLPRLRGTVPLARSPDGALAHTRASRQCWSQFHREKPNLLSEACSHSLARPPAPLHCAPSPQWTFFSCPAQPFDCPAHRPAANSFTIRLFPHGTVLLQRGVGIRL